MFCYLCRKEKEKTAFPKGKKICTVCYKSNYGDPEEIDRKRNERVRRKQKERIYKRKEKCQQIIIDTFQRSNGCVDCGTTDIRVLQFDHRDPSEKEHKISSLIGIGRSFKLKEELQKCDVVCANCHLIRTANMFGS